MTEYDTIVHKGEMQMPSVMFMYDMSPISVTITETRKSFAHLLVRFCAVVGGVFAVTGMSCGLFSQSLKLFTITVCYFLYSLCSCAAVRDDGDLPATIKGLHCLAMFLSAVHTRAQAMLRCYWGAQILLTLLCTGRDAGQMGPQAGDSSRQGLTSCKDSSLHSKGEVLSGCSIRGDDGLSKAKVMLQLRGF